MSLSILFFLTFFSAISTGVRAESDGIVELRANEVFATVLSPFCPGRLLQDCPSSEAGKLKDEIRERLRSGESKDDIRGSIFERYGREFDPVPPSDGFGGLAWLVPILFFCLGFFILVKFSRKSK